MFFFSKPKANLADLIPDGYVDIHSHLLPGIDDGAKNPEHSLKLIRSLKEYGFTEFIATPHVLTDIWDNTSEGITATLQSTKPFLTENGIINPFRAAAEYIMDEAFSNLFKSQPLLTLKDNYVLVEMSYLNAPIQLYDILYDLQVAGYKPVLAHPERYLFYHRKFEEYSRLKKAGCKFQINLLSTTGYYGREVLEAAQRLLDEDMIDFAGSDTHHERHVEAYKNKVQLKKTDKLVAALKNNTLFKF